MEHGGDDASAEMFGIGGDRENGLARCLEQQIVDHRRLVTNEPAYIRACLQLGEFCARTDQNQTQNM